MAKITKTSIMEMINSVKENIKGESLALAEYLVDNFKENPRNVTVDELKEALSTFSNNGYDILKMANFKPEPQAVEGAIKPKKLTKKKDDKKEEEPKTEEKKEEKKEDTKKEKTAKKESKVEEDKKVEDTKKDKPEINTLVVSFPETLDTPYGKLKLRSDIKDIKELAKLINEDELDLVICASWTEKDLRRFSYDPFGVSQQEFTSFPNDLDILDIYYASENDTVVYTISLYSEVHSTFTRRGFETVDGVRACEGMEYQIYEKIAEEK